MSEICPKFFRMVSGLFEPGFINSIVSPTAADKRIQILAYTAAPFKVRKFKRTTEIYIEATRRYVVQPSPTTPATEQFFCPECGSLMLAAERLAELFGVSRRVVYRKIETSATHFHETGDGLLYICADAFGNYSTNEEIKL